MAGQAEPSRLGRFLWRRGFLLLGIAVFALVRVQSGSWWWALLASFAANPGLPIAIGLVLGARAGEQVDTDPKVFIPVPKIADDDRSRHCVAEILGARDELIQTGSARIELARDIEVELTDLGRGLFARGMNKVFDAMRHHVAEGVMDLGGQRAMLDYGQYAEAQIGVHDYAGYSGGPMRPRADAPAYRSDERPTPLWFVGVLGHAVRAADRGEDEVNEVRCRRLDVLLDLSGPTPPGPPQLWNPGWPDPGAVPMVVWLEGSLLRRLRYEETPGTTYTLTLRDLGLDLAGLDWARLGTFRTPETKLGTDQNVV